jgi:hypothetical protein
LLPAGAFAGWDLHPLKSATFSRRTPRAHIGPLICLCLSVKRLGAGGEPNWARTPAGMAESVELNQKAPASDKGFDAARVAHHSLGWFDRAGRDPLQVYASCLCTRHERLAAPTSCPHGYTPRSAPRRNDKNHTGAGELELPLPSAHALVQLNATTVGAMSDNGRPCDTEVMV